MSDKTAAYPMRSAVSAAKILDERAQELAHRRIDRDDADAFDILICSVGASTYGFHLKAIGTVMPAAETSPVPNPRPGQMGLLGHGGIIYNVFDLNAALGHARGDHRNGHIVILRGSGPRIGFRVDHASAVAAVTLDTHEAAPSPVAEGVVIGYARPIHVSAGSGNPVALLDGERMAALVLSPSSRSSGV